MGGLSILWGPLETIPALNSITDPFYISGGDVANI